MCITRSAVRDSFNIADPHLCIDAWTTHARHLIYASAEDNVLIIQTDFSAQYSHKAAWTNTCEHPPTSNMDVFVVTRVVIDKAERTRTYVTDVWRIFSAAKGSSAFHNECLRQITEFYRGVIALAVVYVCTDGCRGQYKGKRNFYKISTFASEHSKVSYVLGSIPMVQAASYEASHAPTNKDLAAVVDAVLAGAVAAADATVTEATMSRSATSPRTLPRRRAPTVRASSPPEVFDVVLRHFFACGHHFKGPHDGYGKDAKFMPKTAERHQRARIATTFDLYNFNATYLPTPRVNVLASEVVAALSPLPPEKLAPLDPSYLPGDWANMLDHLNLPQGNRCLPVDVDPPPVANPTVDPPVANPTPDATPATTDPPEEPDMEGLEADDLNARPTVGAHEEDEDSEAEDAAGDFDFEFDEAGSRVHRPEQLEDEGASASPSSSSTADAGSASAGSASAESPATPPAAKAAKRSRKARVVRMTMKESGCEEHEGGEVRVVTQRAKTPGIFTASAYHWLYYAVYPASGVELIPVGQKCTSPAEAHSILDPAENVDADSVANSNSTYEFAGVDPKQAGLLFSKTLPCMCSICRDPSSIRCAPALARAPSPPSRRCACTHVDRDMFEQRCRNRATPASGEYGSYSTCCDDCNQGTGCTCLCRGCVEHDYSTDPSQCLVCPFNHTSPCNVCLPPPLIPPTHYPSSLNHTTLACLQDGRREVSVLGVHWTVAAEHGNKAPPLPILPLHARVASDEQYCGSPSKPLSHA